MQCNNVIVCIDLIVQLCTEQCMQCGGGGRVGLVGRHQGGGGEGGCLPVGGGGDASAPMWRRKQGGEPVSPPLPLTPHSLLHPCPHPAGHPVGGSEERGGDGGYGVPWMDGVGLDEWMVVVVGVGDGRRVPKAQYSGGSGHPTPDQTGTSQSEWW